MKRAVESSRKFHFETIKNSKYVTRLAEMSFYFRRELKLTIDLIALHSVSSICFLVILCNEVRSLFFCLYIFASSY